MASRDKDIMTLMMSKPPAEALVAGVLLAIVIWVAGFLFQLVATPDGSTSSMITADTLQPMLEFVRGFLNIVAGGILLLAILQYLVRGVLLNK